MLCTSTCASDCPGSPLITQVKQRSTNLSPSQSPTYADEALTFAHSVERLGLPAPLVDDAAALRGLPLLLLLQLLGSLLAEEKLEEETNLEDETCAPLSPDFEPNLVKGSLVSSP